MKTRSIDIETYSSAPLQKSGVYRYVEAEDFEILLFGYSVDSGPVQVVDLAYGEHIPKEILQALEDEEVIKWAFNATFERNCLSRYLGYPTGDYLNPESWRCSMIWAATMGLPLGGVYGATLIPGGSRGCSRIGKAKADRRQRPHQIFLPALRSYQIQWPAYQKQTVPCAG